MKRDDPREGNKANHAGLSISYWRVELHIGSKKARPLKTLIKQIVFVENEFFTVQQEKTGETVTPEA